MQSTTGISVVIPLYNSAAFIGAALQSVLTQTQLPGEIIIIDDGSTDGSGELVQQLAKHSPVTVRYFYQENQGVGAARKRGIELAQGDIIAFQDADDLWPRNKLALQHRLLMQTDFKQIVAGRTRIFSTIPESSGQSSYSRIAEPTWLSQLQSMLIHHNLFTTVGNFDANLRSGEDLEWLWRARTAGYTLLLHPEVSSLYRRHTNNMTNRFQEISENRFAILRKKIKGQ